MFLVGLLIIIGLGVLVGWRFISEWRAFRRIKRDCILIEARVTEVKREERMVTQLGGASSTFQKLGDLPKVLAASDTIWVKKT